MNEDCVDAQTDLSIYYSDIMIVQELLQAQHNIKLRFPDFLYNFFINYLDGTKLHARALVLEHRHNTTVFAINIFLNTTDVFAGRFYILFLQP